MSHAPIPAELLPQADQSADIAALRSVIQRLEADNQQLHEQVAAVASANVHAAELMVELHEAQTALAAYNRVCPTFYIWHFNRSMRSCCQP